MHQISHNHEMLKLAMSFDFTFKSNPFFELITSCFTLLRVPIINFLLVKPFEMNDSQISILYQNPHRQKNTIFYRFWFFATFKLNFHHNDQLHSSHCSPNYWIIFLSKELRSLLNLSEAYTRRFDSSSMENMAAPLHLLHIILIHMS